MWPRAMSEGITRSSRSVALIAGRYELVRECGASADTLRWEAFDAELERRVVLEFPRHDVADDPDAAERFWQQARTSARTSTVAGERVLDAGTDAETGRVFVVREWPQGTTQEKTAALRLPKRVTRPRQRRTLITPRLVVTAGLVALGLAMLLVVRAGAQSWLEWVNAPLVQISNQFVLGPVPTAQANPPGPAPATQPAAVATRGSVPATPTAPATVRPTATSAATAGVTRRIVNTDGIGVALRGSPGGDRLPGKGYDEGATVTAFEQSGQWTRIRGADGREGWVLSVTLG
jgi:hypothetical protein